MSPQKSAIIKNAKQPGGLTSTVIKKTINALNMTVGIIEMGPVHILDMLHMTLTNIVMMMKNADLA